MWNTARSIATVDNAVKAGAHLNFDARYIRRDSAPSPPYIGLYDHPGVGEAHVALGAEQLEAFLQILLGVVVDLKETEGKEI